MTCTLVALTILVAMSSFSFGATPIILALITVSVALSLDYLFSKVLKDRGPVNTLSAAVFGLIVALSYSLGVYTTFTIEILPLQAPQAYYYAAAIAAVGMIVFKKLQGLTGRKYVNPAATAKLVVLSPFIYQTLLTPRHLADLGSLARPIDNNGISSFGAFLQSCMVNPANVKIPFAHTYTDIFSTLIVQKYHGWIGGVSSLAVVIVGLAVFVICRKSFKWRITLSYMLAVSAMSLIMTGLYGGDALLRIGFELFIGSSIFLAFFMATDPATTPKSNQGQAAFGIGIGALTVLIQTYMGFLGGSILALVIMNLIFSFKK
jgi:electron transport complex protein RnfD